MIPGYVMPVRYSNTARPCNPELHYLLTAGSRLPGALPLACAVAAPGWGGAG